MAERIRFLDLTGQIFGRWTVLTHASKTDKSGNAYWLCQCACGTQREVVGRSLTRGRSTSCGCPTDRAQAEYGKWRSSMPEYRAWDNMKRRCNNPNAPAYPNYGGRGIRVTPEWLDDFQAFYDHVGPRPAGGYSLDRIDNDGDYEPGNVRWATAVEQVRNSRASKRNTAR